jgi:hypothetical protein
MKQKEIFFHLEGYAWLSRKHKDDTTGKFRSTDVQDVWVAELVLRKCKGDRNS